MNKMPLSWSRDAGGRQSLKVSDRLLFQDIELGAPNSIDMMMRDDTITLAGSLPSEGTGPGARVYLRHTLGPIWHIWIPHLAPDVGYVIGDHAFRSPAVLLVDDTYAVALIPDLDDVRDGYHAGWQTWMDYDHPNHRITFGAGAYETAPEHVLYRSSTLDYAGQPVLLRMHVVVSDDPQDLWNPFGMLSRWLWERWGHDLYEKGQTQKAPFATYRDHILRWAFSSKGWGDTVWQEFEIDGEPVGGPAFIVDVAQHPSIPPGLRKWREPRSIWNQAWFSTQRCANGMLRASRHVGSDGLAARARLCTRLALKAPQTDGLFPSVYTTAGPGERKGYIPYANTPEWGLGRWSNSDRRPPFVSEQAFHLLDSAFTARLLLEWSDLNTGDEEALSFVRRFADKLCTVQLDSGAFPGWIEADGLMADELREGPETAMGVTLLLNLLRRNPNQTSYRDVAELALQYLIKGPVEERRWEDFETYYSCSSWGRDRYMGKVIPRNGIYKQNTFSLFWCAEAFLAAWIALEDRRYLNYGRRCLDELSLHQQIWNPPFIPAPCHGGFGVMNCDGEWNDARQSLFAPLYLAYYQETGNAEYFERGVSALRSSFYMLYCPENAEVKEQYERAHPAFGPESYGFMMENIAHTGPAASDGSAIGSFTIFTWGNGAAVEAACKIHDLFGQVYVDTERRQAFAIDGCSVLVTDENVEITDHFSREALLVRFATGRSRMVNIDGGKAVIQLSGADV